MKVKKLAKKIKELNIEGCTDCPFYKRDGCKIHGNICIDNSRNINNAKGLLQLEHFVKTKEIIEILEEKESD